MRIPTGQILDWKIPFKFAADPCARATSPTAATVLLVKVQSASPEAGGTAGSRYLVLGTAELVRSTCWLLGDRRHSLAIH